MISHGDASNYLTNKAKYCLTFGFCFIFFSHGTSNTLVVSTLLDIKDNLSTSLETAAYGLTIGSICHSVSYLICKLVRFFSSNS